MTKLIPKPLQSRPIDRLLAPADSLTARFKEEKERRESFLPCTDCKDLGDCSACVKKLESSTTTPRFASSWYNESGESISATVTAAEERSSQTLATNLSKSLTRDGRKNFCGVDEIIEKIRLGGWPEELLKDLYGMRAPGILEELEGHKRNWRDVCLTFKWEHELGIAKGWAWISEGNAEEVGKRRYNPAGKLKVFNAATTSYLELAAGKVPSNRGGISDGSLA